MSFFRIPTTVFLTNFKSCFYKLEWHVGNFCATHRLARVALFVCKIRLCLILHTNKYYVSQAGAFKKSNVTPLQIVLPCNYTFSANVLKASDSSFDTK